jgi:cystathionine beta-lyase/cystathionine gamma-synthase
LIAALRAGDHLLVCDNVYRPLRNFCDGVLTRYGVETTYLDPRIGMAIENCSSPVPAPCCWKRRVRNPSRCRLETDPGHTIWKRDFSGACGLFSIVPKPQAVVDVLLDSLKLFGMGYSWDGFESLAIPFDCTDYRSATKMGAGGTGGAASYRA